VIVYAIIDGALRLRVRWAKPSRRLSAEDAERFIEKVRGDDPELASHLRIEERELKAGGLNLAVAEAEGPFQASIDR
jgi:hypothetical protein